MKKILKVLSISAALFLMSCGANSTAEQGCCGKEKAETCAKCEKCSSGDKSNCKMDEDTALHKCCKEKIANGEKACCSKAS
ncbi:hypothetical protein MY04_0693 [Flammeovirga sp. MY04]|uniref:hypothetical protein n=1 Tax=Flammeovirga sp. MY04 TaxID=1191459 RepID=UPI0008060936|nr:hypothetical protein [Flammeovirga sp. MY04]ANQ48075.1 hypothetical protein MY04_0693 [Flammeovirga sp. MY04]